MNFLFPRNFTLKLNSKKFDEIFRFSSVQCNHEIITCQVELRFSFKSTMRTGLQGPKDSLTRRKYIHIVLWVKSQKISEVFLRIYLSN